MAGNGLRKRWWIAGIAVGAVIAVAVPLLWWSAGDEAEFSESGRCQPSPLTLPDDTDSGAATAVSADGKYLGGRADGRPVLWHDNEVTVVGAPGRIDAGVRAVNAAGVAVGYTDAGRHGDDWVFRDDGIHTLLPPAASYEKVEAADVNDSGVIVGSAAGPARGETTALWWKDGATKASSLGEGRARAVSDKNLVVGESVAADDKLQARVWKDGAELEVPSFDGDDDARARAVAGKWVLLEARGEQSRYFRWKIGSQQAREVELADAVDIDRSGRVYGVASQPAPAEQQGGKVNRLALPPDSADAGAAVHASDPSGKFLVGKISDGDNDTPLWWKCK